jgi:hypothetical protein
VDQPVTGPAPDDPDAHPYAASRGALIGAFFAVVVAGLSGAAIGYGLVGIGCTGGRPPAPLDGRVALRRHPPLLSHPDRFAVTNPPECGGFVTAKGQTANVRRRKPSA